MRLSDAREGERVLIEDLGDSPETAEIIRLGLTVGRTVTILRQVPGGPAVVESGAQQIALGKELKDAIRVRLL